MTPSLGLAAAVGSLAALLVVGLLVAVGIAHVLRTRRQEQARLRRAELRPLVHALLDDEAASADVTGAPAELDAVVLELLPSLRGTDRALLQKVLAERGVVARAARDLTARAAWRRGRAATLLGATSGTHHTAALTLLLGDRALAVRCAAARALGKTGDPAAVPALMAALTARRPLPQGVVGMAVLDIGTAALPALRETVRDGSSPAQAVAAELIGVHGDLTGSGVLESALTDVSRGLDVRRAAATALGRIGSPRSADPLSRVLTLAGAPRLRCTAAEALGRIGDPAAIPALTAGLVSPDAGVPVACADALVALGAEGRELLEAMAAAGGRASSVAQAALDAAPASRRETAAA